MILRDIFDKTENISKKHPLFFEDLRSKSKNSIFKLKNN